MIRAFIFDMDGVLVDSEPLHLEAINLVLKPHGVALSEVENRAYLGWTEAAFWEAVRARFDLPGSAVEYGGERRRHLRALLVRGVLPVPGVVEFLARLDPLDLRRAVASSSDESVIRQILEALGIGDRFDAITAGDHVRRSKPDPEIFLATAARLGLEPADCLVFEDSPQGILAARRAGMRCVRVLTKTTRELECEPTDRVIENFIGLDPGELLCIGGP